MSQDPPPPLTDDELLVFLGVKEDEFASPQDKAAFLARIADKRPTYHRMYELTVGLQQYEAGIGPKPTGVLLDFDRKEKRGRKGIRKSFR